MVEIQNLNDKIDEKLDITNETLNKKIECLAERLAVIENTLQKQEDMFWRPLKFSFCDLLPFIWKNKWILILIWTMLSIWISVIDYAVRSL